MFTKHTDGVFANYCIANLNLSDVFRNERDSRSL